jgi:hypothetical protein
MATTSETIVCPRCGERLPEGFTRCDACGAYLVAHPGDAPAAPRAAGPRRGAAPRTPSRVARSPWLFLAVGLVLGGAVGYALHSAVGPRSDGGMPSGPADIMAGAGSGGVGSEAPGGGMGPSGGLPAGAQMPPEVVAQIQKYRSALAMDPNDLQANIGMGNLLFDSNQFDRAIEHYTKALDKDPKNADVRVDRAIAYHSMGQDPKAKEEILRVTREHPEHRNAWLNLGVVSIALGDRETAIRAWERYLELDPNGQHAAAIRDELQQLKRGG